MWGSLKAVLLTSIFLRGGPWGPGTQHCLSWVKCHLKAIRRGWGLQAVPGPAQPGGWLLPGWAWHPPLGGSLGLEWELDSMKVAIWEKDLATLA